MTVEITAQVRRATLADGDAIAQFNLAMAQETEGKALDAATVGAGVVSLMHQPQYGFYTVVETQTGLAGCLLITYEWSDWRNGLIWWIQSVYVHPDYRRQGLFKQLYAQVREWAQAEEACGLRLYVEAANHSAQSTYTALGMKPAGYQVFEALF
ncbi:GNAT family N-acetyltransferase [Pseudanabaena sp. FACHB-2040]|uniref:GNAT family N-acetyltransferase n=1 Tax=Pseudanabaena sp. FACHB-2040 TaxID=2692859 RepID=UPI00168738AB|nr:GNAT family N-acetyltransferase [Pseudanabaena sp. FACHB-2040]MBD2259793.1 GNAT family N-acetyltransferase [Pseudanabaena sp. FACHB-2040]